MTHNKFALFIDVLVSDKFQFVPKNIVLHNNGTEFDETDALLVFGTDVL